MISYPEEIITAVYYHIAPLKGYATTEKERELFISDITEQISKMTAPRRNYDMSLKEVESLVSQVFDKHVHVIKEEGHDAVQSDH